jgi:photosystem II stability/assembly factor-like uncharacterized protein
MSLLRRCRAGSVALFALGALTFALQAQRPAKQPAFKGIWEPISYTEDLDLHDVYFVTVDVGWAAGEAGTIIRTNDGGDSWTVTLGGDPASTEEPIQKLRFIDEHHGWAVQGGKLLRTTDGDSWEEYGVTPRRMGDYVFLSAQSGVAAGGVSDQSTSQIFRTDDAGKTWNHVAQCEVKALINGVNQTVRCEIGRIHFPTPDVGYLVGKTSCAGMGCGGPPMIGKTEDGGSSWTFKLGPGTHKADLEDVYFLDERTGFVHVKEGDTRKLYSTTDAGETWRGVVSTPGAVMRFADPEVGWALDLDWIPKMAVTVDGGKRWSSRQLRFPTYVLGWSFPRRDRAYVVGQKGMIFRYRMVPVAEPLKAGAIAAPAMPAFASTLDDEVVGLETLVSELSSSIGGLASAPENGGGVTATEPVFEESAPPPSVEELIAAPLSEFAGSCCSKPVNKLNVLLGAVSQSLPAFLAKYKNMNLLVAGLRAYTELPDKYGDLRAALRAFKEAKDKESAQAALARVTAATRELQQATKAAFQTEPPPVASQ